MDPAHPGRGAAAEEGLSVLRARDPEKWEPVFGKDHAQDKKLERDDGLKKNHPALTPRARRGRTAWRRALPALAVWAALCAGAQADDADLGREVYDDFCATCHGRDMVNPGGVTFDLRKFPKDDFERFRNAVVNGKPPAMPPWRDKVSDDDVKLLWAYLRSGGGLIRGDGPGPIERGRKRRDCASFRRSTVLTSRGPQAMLVPDRNRL
jgi:mono/diheme cytochrome c family protein